VRYVVMVICTTEWKFVPITGLLSREEAEIELKKQRGPAFIGRCSVQ
jgi:hypothetical protein